MQWKDLESTVLTFASLLISLQVYWIGAVLRRNQRRRLREPLSAMGFQRELQRILSRANELS